MVIVFYSQTKLYVNLADIVLFSPNLLAFARIIIDARRSDRVFFLFVTDKKYIAPEMKHFSVIVFFF